MPAELARSAWELPPLTPAELGPYGRFPRLSDAEKSAVWRAARAREPGRVPVTLATNSRVLLLDRRFDAEGLTYARLFADPQAMLIAQLRWQYLCRRRYHVLCDQPTGLPEQWEVGVDLQNVYDAAALGAPVHFHPDGVPDTRPILTDDRKRAIFDVPIDRPLELPFLKERMALGERMRALAEGRTFCGRPIRVLPFAVLGTDGPLTVALNLRGPALLSDVKRDPEYVRELLGFLVSAALARHAAFRAHWGLPPPEEVWLADDSIALLSPSQYREFVLPHHRTWYDTLDPQRQRVRGMHLCGDATRHFRTLRDACGVTVFDTGFPVDFAGLRRELGPDVEILGGVEVPLLLDGAPERVYARARGILESGVLAGRFVLREANNLPPGVPWSNLAAMYQAAFDFGLRPPGA